MTQGSDTEGVVTVDADGVTVEKRFSADEFPVPAIEFTLRSDRDAPTEFRLVDDIPEDFPMDRIGFHPEYESEHWTAYQDHRVEYRRRLDPGEEVTTVYGIRTDDPDEGERFLGTPTVAEVTEDDDPVGDVADVIGDDSSQAVRDVLTGETDANESDDLADDVGAAADDGGIDLAGAEADLNADAVDPLDESDGEVEDATDDVGDRTDSDDGDAEEALGLDEPVAADTASDPEPGTEADDRPAESDDQDTDLGDLGVPESVESDEKAAGGEAAADEPEDILDLDSDEETLGDDDADEVDDDVEAVGESGDELDEEVEDLTDDVDESTEGQATAPSDDGGTAVTDEDTADGGALAAAGTGTDGIAAALAAELRAGNVSEADRQTLTEELELDHSTSVDARIARLQSKVEDVAAYADALEEFIDDNGFAEEWMDGLQADLDELTESLDETWTELDHAADERDDIRSEIETVDEEVEAVWDDVDEWGDELEKTTDDLESWLEELRSDLDNVTEELSDEDEAVAELRDDIVDLGDEMESVSAMVDDELSEMRTELETVHEELAEFEEFRERLSSVFGPGGAATDGDESEE